MSKYDCIIFSRSNLGKTATIYPAPGIHRIATEVRSLGMSCQLVQHMNWFTVEEMHKLLCKIIGSNTKIIGFSTTFWRHATEEDIRATSLIVDTILSYIDTHYTNIKIIVGGNESSEISKKYIRRVDAIFLDFPEGILSKYLISVRDNSPAPIEDYRCHVTGAAVYKPTEIFDFSKSKIKYEDNDYIQDRSTLSIEVGRGCIFKCGFCSFKLNGKKKFDYLKDVDVLKQEMIDNYDRYKTQTYILTDDTFNDSTHKVQLLHDMFVSLPFKVYFSAYIRLDLLHVHREQIPLLKNMGLTGAFFGIESFHHKAASNIGKGLNPDIAKQLLYDLKDDYWGNDVKITTSLIIGLPYETIESYEETKKWILSPKNNVDIIDVFPLHVTDPLKYPDGNLSKFAIESAKYGFYWVKSNPNWKNINGPIKSFEEAELLCKEFVDATKSVNKNISGPNKGSFEIFMGWNSNPQSYNISFTDLLRMTPEEYMKWKQSKNIPGLIHDYKKKLLDS